MVLIIAIIPAAAAAAASVGRQVICTKAAQKTERQIVASVVMKLANTGGSAVAAAVATEIGGVTGAETVAEGRNTTTIVDAIGTAAGGGTIETATEIVTGIGTGGGNRLWIQRCRHLSLTGV
jgi:hypothetical protein